MTGPSGSTGADRLGRSAAARRASTRQPSSAAPATPEPDLAALAALALETHGQLRFGDDGRPYIDYPVTTSQPPAATGLGDLPPEDDDLSFGDWFRSPTPQAAALEKFLQIVRTSALSEPRKASLLRSPQGQISAIQAEQKHYRSQGKRSPAFRDISNEQLNLALQALAQPAPATTSFPAERPMAQPAADTTAWLPPVQSAPAAARPAATTQFPAAASASPAQPAPVLSTESVAVYDTWGNATGRSVSYADARRYHYTFVFMNDVVFGASATKFNLAGKKKLGLQPMGDGNFRRTPAGSTPNRRSVQRPHSMVTAWGVFVGAIFAFVLYVVLQGFGVASLLVNLLPAHHSTINFFGTMILEVVVFAFGDHLGNKHAHRRHIRRQVSSDIER